jgi:hypothetical protein
MNLISDCPYKKLFKGMRKFDCGNHYRICPVINCPRKLI